MREQPVMLKVLLRDKHWQNYSTFCAEYDKAARQIDPELAGQLSQPRPAPPLADRRRAQPALRRSLPGAGRDVPRLDRRAALPARHRRTPAWQDPRQDQPVFAALSTGLRPFIEQAFTAEHVAIDFAGFSGETLHGVIQEPLDKIRTGADQARQRHNPDAAARHHQADGRPVPGRGPRRRSRTTAPACTRSPAATPMRS